MLSNAMSVLEVPAVIATDVLQVLDKIVGRAQRPLVGRVGRFRDPSRSTLAQLIQAISKIRMVVGVEAQQSAASLVAGVPAQDPRPLDLLFDMLERCPCDLRPWQKVGAKVGANVHRH
jgi:hypothetical protein